MKFIAINRNVERLLETIKEQMRDKKINQQKIANEMGITRKHLNRMLNGHAKIALEDALLLCELVNMDAKEVFFILYRS